MKKVFIVSASGVKNLELAQQFEAKLLASGAEVTLLNLVDLKLPLYTSASEPLHNAKELLGPYFDQMIEARGFIFVSPEYNGGLPPTLTNFLAWVSRISKDWRECFNAKTAAIASHSGGGTQALTMMRLQLSYIGMNVLGRQMALNFSKPVDEATLEVMCQQLLAHSPSAQ